MRVLDNGTLRTITGGWVKQAGILRRLKTMKVKDGDTLRLVGKFASPLSASLPEFTSTGEVSPPSPQVVSAQATVIVTGGFPPFSYSWVRVSGNSFTIGSPSGATTTFSAPLIAPSALSGLYRVTVTDALGDTATAETTVSLILS